MPVNKFQIRDTGPIKLAEAENLPSVVIIAGPNGGEVYTFGDLKETK